MNMIIKVLKERAMEMDIPYQTPSSGMIHRYIEGELLSKTG
jgi:hypothetical protein